MSFLRTEGHVEPEDYPLWYLGVEAEIARRRCNQVIATKAALAASGYAAAKSKDAAKVFKKSLEKLE